MTVFVATFVDPSPAFDRKSAEVAYIAKTLFRMAADLQKAQGTVTSGNVLGNSSGGVANTTMASWTYTPAASNP